MGCDYCHSGVSKTLIPYAGFSDYSTRTHLSLSGTWNSHNENRCIDIYLSTSLMFTNSRTLGGALRKWMAPQTSGWPFSKSRFQLRRGRRLTHLLWRTVYKLLLTAPPLPAHVWGQNLRDRFSAWQKTAKLSVKWFPNSECGGRTIFGKMNLSAK